LNQTHFFSGFFCIFVLSKQENTKDMETELYGLDIEVAADRYEELQELLKELAEEELNENE
jgi:hypothetical protein